MITFNTVRKYWVSLFRSVFEISLKWKSFSVHKTMQGWTKTRQDSLETLNSQVNNNEFCH